MLDDADILATPGIDAPDVGPDPDVESDIDDGALGAIAEVEPTPARDEASANEVVVVPDNIFTVANGLVATKDEIVTDGDASSADVNPGIGDDPPSIDVDLSSSDAEAIVYNKDATAVVAVGFEEGPDDNGAAVEVLLAGTDEEPSSVSAPTEVDNVAPSEVMPSDSEAETSNDDDSGGNVAAADGVTGLEEVSGTDDVTVDVKEELGDAFASMEIEIVFCEVKTPDVRTIETTEFNDNAELDEIAGICADDIGKEPEGLPIEPEEVTEIDSGDVGVAFEKLLGDIKEIPKEKLDSLVDGKATKLWVDGVAAAIVVKGDSAFE
ncbi:hypothetical protein BP5796_03976 [Coleophoma crateriformis]|uniref:Uncharacterized protein n=1 Tax=Coleophoma crateriformis TaxID=565419 RepID=A0A3D8SHK2_9HELO|nr:hypothetical protein BP5796_03976 [Coleophoma crateriformis]